MQQGRSSNQPLLHNWLKKRSETGAAIAGVKAKDTMKRVHNHIIEETVDREQLWMIQTPQAFHTDILVKAQQASGTGWISWYG